MSTRPDQFWLTSGRWYLNCDSCIMYECIRMGNHVVWKVYQSSYIWTWKESEVDRSLMDVRTGCWEVRTDASWNRSFSIQWRVRTNENAIIFAVQSLLKILWQVESNFTASLHISDFVQTQNEAKILTNSPFGHSGTKITWPVWKYIPSPKIKITSPFCHKGTKGKPE